MGQVVKGGFLEEVNLELILQGWVGIKNTYREGETVKDGEI